MLDVFNSDAFSIRTLTAAVNEMPHVPGRIGSMGLFQSQGIPTTTLAIESLQGVLNLIQTTPRGAPGIQHTPEKRSLRSFQVAHIQLDDHVAADEIQGVREFGSDNAVKTLQNTINGRFSDMFSNIDATLENIRMGAIKGQVLDADGTTVLWDLFTEFGVTQDADVDFVLGTSSTNIKQKCQTVVRRMIDILGASSMMRVHALCGDDFFDKLATHQEVRDAYNRPRDGMFLREEAGPYESFTYGGITFENYRGAVGGSSFVDTGECHFFPVGVNGLFVERFGPADYNETVNTVGLPRYAKSIADPNDKGVALEAQTNVICLNTRPLTLRKGITSN